MPRKEMITSGDDFERTVPRQCSDESPDALTVTEFVPISLYEEGRLRRPGQEARVRDQADRKPESHQSLRSAVAHTDSEGDRGAERKASEHNRRIGQAVQNLRDRGANVILLSTAVVVLPIAPTDPSEVEPEHREPLLLQRLGGSEDDLEVHHPPVEWMRMANDRGGHRPACRPEDDALEPPRRPSEVDTLIAPHTVDYAISRSATQCDRAHRAQELHSGMRN